MVTIENLPLQLKKRGLEERLVKICEENDIVFMAIFGSFVRGQQTKKATLTLQ